MEDPNKDLRALIDDFNRAFLALMEHFNKECLTLIEAFRNDNLELTYKCNLVKDKKSYLRRRFRRTRSSYYWRIWDWRDVTSDKQVIISGSLWLSIVSKDGWETTQTRETHLFAIANFCPPGWRKDPGTPQQIALGDRTKRGDGWGESKRRISKRGTNSSTESGPFTHSCGFWYSL